LHHGVPDRSADDADDLGCEIIGRISSSDPEWAFELPERTAMWCRQVPWSSSSRDMMSSVFELSARLG